METEAFNAGLPPAFDSWYQLWNKWVEIEGRPGDIFKSDYIDEDGNHKHAFTMDYVKARCFDELCAQPFTYSELNAMEKSAKDHFNIITVDNFGNLYRKIEAHRELAFKLKLL